MSLLGSLFTGVAGLNAQGRSMGIISDNIANVGTTGYKGSVASFASLVSRAGNDAARAGGGVEAFTSQGVGRQGLIQASASATDLAIEGGGFFVVDTRADGGGERLFTRAGSFAPDALGNLRLPSGHYLQGWQLAPDGTVADVDTLATVNVRAPAGAAKPTGNLAITANLDAGQAPVAGYAAGDMARFLASGGGAGVAPQLERRVQIHDALGGAHDLTMAFVKTGAGSWSAELVLDPGSVAAPPHADGLIASVALDFDGTGALAGMTMTPVAAGADGGASVQWAGGNGAAPSELMLDAGAGGLSQHDGDFSFVADQDGLPAGRFARASVDEDGYVIASFTNGTSRRLYRLPLAVFPNPAGLDPRSGTVWASSVDSGTGTLHETGTGGAGGLSPSSLEGSTVDLAEEFTRMIVTQRAYSASARVISTADEMLEEVSRLRR